MNPVELSVQITLFLLQQLLKAVILRGGKNRYIINMLKMYSKLL